MRRCTKCGIEKELDEFPWKYKGLNIRHYVCKTCYNVRSRKWYEGNKESHKEKAGQIRKGAIQKAQEYVYMVLSYSVCQDCGEYDPNVLEFDHVRGKKFKDVSVMAALGYSIESIDAEIRKCEIVCRNCHMRREKRRRGSIYSLF